MERVGIITIALMFIAGRLGLASWLWVPLFFVADFYIIEALEKN